MAITDWWTKTSTPPPSERKTAEAVPFGHEMRNGQLVYTGFPTAQPDDWDTQLRRMREQQGDLDFQMSNLRSLMDTFRGDEYWALNWVLGQDMEALQDRSRRNARWTSIASAERHLELAERDEAAGKMPPESSEFWARQLESARSEPQVTGGRGAGLPIPDWMREFIADETGEAIPGVGLKGQAMARREAGSKTAPYQGTSTDWRLRPIGAQEELEQGELKQLGGYLGWQKAGRPTRGGTGFAETLATKLPDWWTDYISRSQSLFPATHKPSTWWRAAKQR